MKDHLAKLIARLDASARVQEPVKIHEVFKAAASDIITMYAFDNSFSFLDMPDYGKTHFEATDKFFFLTHICVLFPFLYPLIQGSPDWLLQLLFPDLIAVRERQNVSTEISVVLPVLVLTKKPSGGLNKLARSASHPTPNSQSGQFSEVFYRVNCPMKRRQTSA